MIRSFLVILAMLVGTTASAQAPLPQFVRGLSADGYNTWAAWQNKQAQLRADDESLYEDPYIYTTRRVLTVQSGSKAASAHTSAFKRGRGKVGATSNTSSWSTVTSELQPRRYVNPTYSPPGAVTIYNPFVQPSKAAGGIPDWNKLFVPCEYGTQTLAEALMEVREPISAEKLYDKLLRGWF